MPKVYEVLALNRSNTTGEQYEVRSGADGVIYCNCKGWMFSKAPKSCKHLRLYAADLVAHPVPLQTVPYAVPGSVALPRASAPADPLTAVARAIAAVVVPHTSPTPAQLATMTGILRAHLATIGTSPAAVAMPQPTNGRIVRLITFDD